MEVPRQWLRHELLRPLAGGAAVRALAVGQSVRVGPGELGCNLLASAGRYLVSVQHPATTRSALAPYVLAGGDPAAPAAAPLARRAAAAPGPADPHLAVLEESRELARRLGPPPRREVRGVRAALLTRKLYARGDTVHMRVPSFGNTCYEWTDVVTRVAYASARSLVLEDVAAPLAGRMDDDYARLGREFEEVQLGVLRAYFGDPLGMDDRSDGDGRVIMFFSPQVNRTGALGFVTAVDFFPRETCPSSNVGEVMYVVVPTSDLPDRLGDRDTRAGWALEARMIVVHEARHLAAFAERLSRGYDLETGWLEESTAGAAEEMWVRHVRGVGPLANAAFGPIVHCDMQPRAAGCEGHPYAMFDLFRRLYAYLGLTSSLTPLGPGEAPGTGALFYGSGWSLVRWAADHSGRTEAEFFRELVRSSATGAANLEARAGIPWEEILSGWSLALAADDLPGFTPADPRHRFPGWNLRDVFARMSSVDAFRFPAAVPLPATELTGSFSVTAAGVGGGAALFRVAAGAQGSSSPSAAPPAAPLRRPCG